MEEFSKRDDNATPNYFIAIEGFSNLGVILELKNHVNNEIECLAVVKRN